MTNYNNLYSKESEERLKALHTNVNAIRNISSAIEGTLGPKGLDTMLVDENGKVIITNDGVTILNKIEANHPAAKMLIQIARSQQQEIGDGTTTATILACELLSEAVNQVNKGVPIPKVIVGIKEGINIAIKIIKEHSRTIDSNDNFPLERIAYIAGREHKDIAELIIKGALLLGYDKLNDSNYKFVDSIIAHEGLENELITGLILSKKKMNPQMPNKISNAKVMVIQDAFEPEDIDDDALGTEIGFSKYLEYKEVFKQNLIKIKELGINVVAVGRGVDPLAEEFCNDNGIMVIQRLASQELKKIVDNTGAKGINRIGLSKDIVELETYLGYAKLIYEDEKLEKTRIIEGNGKPIVTILVGAVTGAIVDERERIAKDSAASVQAAIRGGYVPGGGAIELFVAKELEKSMEQFKGLERFGIQTVVQALRKPMAQIVLNAGFNPLEKVEEASTKQKDEQNDSIGINTDNGSPMDMEKNGVLDSTLVKIHSLKVAGELTEAILRINTIIKMKNNESDN